jgi:hypothetical protein
MTQSSELLRRGGPVRAFSLADALLQLLLLRTIERLMPALRLRPQFRDQPQNLLEHLSWNGDLRRCFVTNPAWS